MGTNKDISPEHIDCDRECLEKYDEEYERKYYNGCDMKEYDNHDYDKEYNYYDKKCEYNEYDKQCKYHDYNKKSNVKAIQTKVIKGTGCETFFLEADFNFPQAAPLYLIESIDTWVEVYDTKVICENKVIFNAWVYKNIIYKVEDDITEANDTVTVTGTINHITKVIPLAGCINIDTKKCEKLDPCKDFAEVINAKIIGHVEDKLEKEEITRCDNTSYNPPVFVYRSLHEKMCVKIDLKVVGWEHLSIEINDKC